MSDKPYIQLKNICKSFGSVIANHNINLSVNKGEILALLGENGSGKSTLVNMLSGIYSPDSGEIFIDGKAVTFTSPKDAINHGIGMVHQHFKLVDKLSARDNIVIGDKNFSLIKGKKLSEKIIEVANKFGLTINPDKKVYNMSVSEQQTIEIIKVLYRGANVLILDEPTAVLTPQETHTLFNILKKMKAEGCAIIIITHKLHEVMEISDRVTVLRKGQSVNTVNTSETSPIELTKLMVGASINLEIKRSKVKKSLKPLLSVNNLEVTDTQGIKVLKNMSFDLFGGEIIGVAGIAGSGQKELCETIAGLTISSNGKIRFMDEDITALKPRDIIKKGISMSFVPEDRLGMGLVAGMNIIDNVMLKNYNKSNGILVNRSEGKKLAENIVEKFEISTPSVNHIVKKLSGGNIQKVLLGREIYENPKVLITAYPVRGLDIGASYNIYEILDEQKKKGVAILFIGEDLDVLLELCDKIMVIHNGEIMDVVDPLKVTKEDLGLLMMGQKLRKEPSDD